MARILSEVLRQRTGSVTFLPRRERMIPSQPHLGRDDATLVAALLQGDERIFSDLVDRCGGMMLRLAISHVASRAIAEDVVQEAWLTVLRSLQKFEGRSSLRTWILGIVLNVARAKARAERR